MIRIPLAEQLACAERLTYDPPPGYSPNDLQAILKTLQLVQKYEADIRALVTVKREFPDATATVRDAHG